MHFTVTIYFALYSSSWTYSLRLTPSATTYSSADSRLSSASATLHVPWLHNPFVCVQSLQRLCIFKTSWRYTNSIIIIYYYYNCVHYRSYAPSCYFSSKIIVTQEGLLKLGCL